MPATVAPRLIRILLVEDNPGDVRLTREALHEGKVRNEMDVMGDGVAALEYLRREARGPDRRPDLILLDLNLPRKSGIEVLREIKGDDDLGRIPVVILTTSDSDRDIVASYDLKANCYITKPVDFHEFIAVVQSIEDFWLNIVTLPPRHDRG